MKTILLYSGGLDSTTLLYKLRAEKHEVECIGFDYGQRHRRELIAAREITEHLNVKFRVVELRGVWTKHDGVFPSDSDVIPNRNMVFISIATAIAIERNAYHVAWGPNRDDWECFPDCRPEFASPMRQAMTYCDQSPIRLITPLISKTKTEVVELAIKLEVPIGATWSCYEGGRKPCRKCAACVTRAEAIAKAQ